MRAPKEIYIASRLTEAVSNHLVKFQCRLMGSGFNAPQIFIIAGPPGNGKTTVVKEVCTRLGVSLHSISASTLGGEYEGQSIAPLRGLYVQAARENAAFMSAILIDDYDLSAGRMDDRLSGTINAAMLNNFIMSLCDDPCSIEVSHSNKPVERHHLKAPPALFMTANDPSQIYQALRRNMRATIFEWLPTGPEMERAFSALYPGCSSKDVRKVVSTFSDQTISFFEALGVRAVDKELGEIMRDYQPCDLPSINYADLAAHLLSVKDGLTAKQLIAAGRTLLAETGNKSYLGKPSGDLSGYSSTHQNGGMSNAAITA